MNDTGKSYGGRPSGRTIRVGLGGIVLLSIWIAGAVAGRKVLQPYVRNSPLWWSVVLWCIFTMYWSAAAKNSAPAKKSEERASRRIHEILVNLALFAVLVPLPGLRERLLPNSLIITVAGLAIQTASGLFGVWARRHLGSNWSGEITIKVDHRLIRSGPYRIVRHPIYTAMLGMFLGTAIVSGQVHALIGMALAILAYWRKIRLEEANLDEAFGAEYARYKRETAALIPGVL